MVDYVDEAQVRQVVYKIKTADNACITEAFKALESLYIADGHHRCAAACRYARENRSDSLDEAAYNYFLGVAFPKDTLSILPYNRIVHLEEAIAKDVFFKHLEVYFTLKEVDYKVPQEKYHVGMYYGEKWYELTLKTCFQEKRGIPLLDVSVLQDYLLKPLFNIEDPRRDKRLSFIGGLDNITRIENQCLDERSIGFSLYPTSMDELMTIADQKGLMPPKSTWLEPQLRSGHFIHPF